jgi:hypothetical protein
MTPEAEHCAYAQREGFRRARSEMFDQLAEAISTGECNPDIATVAFMDRIVETAVIIGIEAQADALSLRIGELEGHLTEEFKPQMDGPFY